MEKAARAQWLSDLRSGKFEQGVQFLVQKREGIGRVQHCCIGVYCSSVPELEEPINRSVADYVPYDEQAGYDEFRYALGFTAREVEYLTAMNDGKMDVYFERRRVKESRSFEFIARWAEIMFALKRQAIE